jgi:glycosyltransferase involved in cell wall biosynthesis
MGYKERDEELISILMPTYNVVKYVREAVESILKQTYTKFELIIVDDCSTDGTYDLLKEMSQSDSRIKLYRNEMNCKICKTLNRALGYAQGGLIGRMDGDDISEANRFERLKDYLDKHPDISLVGSFLTGIDETGNTFNNKKYPCSSKGIEMGNNYMSSVSHIWLARYGVYESLNGYREVPYVEDYDFLLRGELKGFKYANVNECLYRVRVRNGNTVSTNGLSQCKAVTYVQQLHKKECKLKKDCFSHNDYLEAMKFSETENEKYQNAMKKLNSAIKLRKKPVKMIGYAIQAMMNSKYVAKYVFNAFKIRIIILFDSIVC